MDKLEKMRDALEVLEDLYRRYREDEKAGLDRREFCKALSGTMGLLDAEISILEISLKYRMVRASLARK